MALRNIPVDLVVYETSFLLVVRVDPDLTVRVVGVKEFSERGWTRGKKMFVRYIVELGCIFARCF